MQADVPVASELYEPATQAVHTAEVPAVPTVPYVPGTQAVHTAGEEPAAKLLYVPSLQAVHAEAPVATAL